MFYHFYFQQAFSQIQLLHIDEYVIPELIFTTYIRRGTPSQAKT